jgi:plasmid stabilization system protein ParE
VAYVVRLTARAERDLADLYEAINAESSEAALEWYSGLATAIRSLDHHPNRCPVVPEDSSFRHLLYGHKPHIYRVIYRVVERKREVQVVHVRHGARQGIEPSDVV